jgi:3-oxoadipate enol-lactonase
MGAGAQATRRAVLAALAAITAAPPALAQFARAGGAFLPVTGGQLYFEIAGQGSRTVVLIHDDVADSAVWDDVWPVFAREFRVARYDRRGFGRSPAATAPYSTLGDLQAVVDQTGAGGVVLVAGSTAAQTALEYAAAAPARVQQVVLVNPLVGDPGGIAAWRAKMQANSASIATGDVQTAISAWVNDRHIVAGPNRQARARLRAILEASPHNLARADTMARAEPGVGDAAARVRASTLILAGARDLPEVVAAGESLARRMPNAQRAPVQGSGHLIYLDEPEIFAAAAIAFVRAWQSQDP